VRVCVCVCVCVWKLFVVGKYFAILIDFVSIIYNLPIDENWLILLQRVINNFPYYESFEDNGILFIVIEKTYGGWILHSLTCPYYLVYKPLESSQQLKLYLSSYYEGDILGMCQNRNNDPEDDRHTCSVPPVLANGTDFVTVIGESCSCPKNNKRCNKAISRL